MKVYELENILSQVPDGATLKMIVAGCPVEVKDVLIDRTDDEEHAITLLLE